MCRENLKLTFFIPKHSKNVFVSTWLFCGHGSLQSEVILICHFLDQVFIAKSVFFWKYAWNLKKKNLTGCVKSYNQVCVDLFEYNMSCSQHWDCFDSFSLYSLTMLSITCVLIVMGDIRCTEPNTLYFD